MESSKSSEDPKSPKPFPIPSPPPNESSVSKVFSFPKLFSLPSTPPPISFPFPAPLFSSPVDQELPSSPSSLLKSKVESVVVEADDDPPLKLPNPPKPPEPLLRLPILFVKNETTLDSRLAMLNSSLFIVVCLKFSDSSLDFFG